MKEHNLDIWDVLRIIGAGIGIVLIAYMIFSGQTVCFNPVIL